MGRARRGNCAAAVVSLQSGALGLSPGQVYRLQRGGTFNCGSDRVALGDCATAAREAYGVVAYPRVVPTVALQLARPPGCFYGFANKGCPWVNGGNTGLSGMLRCWDGTYCDICTSRQDCCTGRGGRMLCPRASASGCLLWATPYTPLNRMCSGANAGAGGTDYECMSPVSCSELPCESTAGLWYNPHTTGGTGALFDDQPICRKQLSPTASPTAAPTGPTFSPTTGPTARAPQSGGCGRFARTLCCKYLDGETTGTKCRGQPCYGELCVPSVAGKTFQLGTTCEPAVWILDNDPNTAGTCPDTMPSVSPTASPSASPSTHPTDMPLGTPTAVPSAAPVVPPSAAPVVPPSGTPTGAPLALPTARPTRPIAAAPTAAPSVTPTESPAGANCPPRTSACSCSWAKGNKCAADDASRCWCECCCKVNGTCSWRPAADPSAAPTQAPSTVAPSTSPRVPPSAGPSLAPSAAPAAPGVSRAPPSLSPSAAPSLGPSVAPSVAPLVGPSVPPSVAPTVAPSVAPSVAPISRPSLPPSSPPTSTAPPPTAAPSVRPAALPSAPPSAPPAAPPSAPTAPPSAPPAQPSLAPSGPPSRAPSRPPSRAPSRAPSAGQPSASPTQAPTAVLLSVPPSRAPSGSQPSAVPTLSPTTEPPTGAPTTSPSASPTATPTAAPSGFPQPPEPAAGDVAEETAEVAAGVALGAAGASAGAQSGRLVLLTAGCSAQGAEQQMPRMLHPTQLRLGGATLPLHAGCVVAGAAIAAALTVIHFGIGCVVARVRKQGVLSTAARAGARFPALSLPSVSVLSQGPVFAGARLLRYGGEAADYLIGCLGVLFGLAVPYIVLLLGDKGVQGSLYKLDEKARGPIGRWWLGKGEWVSVHHSGAAERFSTAFRAARPGFHSVLAADLLIAQLAMVSAGLGGGSCRACAVGRWVDAALSVVLWIAVAYTRPYNRGHRVVLTLIVQGGVAAASVALAVGFASSDCGRPGAGVLPGHDVGMLLLLGTAALVLVTALLDLSASLRNFVLRRKRRLSRPVSAASNLAVGGSLSQGDIAALLATELRAALGGSDYFDAKGIAKRMGELVGDPSGRVSVRQLFAMEEHFWCTEHTGQGDAPLLTVSSVLAEVDGAASSVGPSPPPSAADRREIATPLLGPAAAAAPAGAAEPRHRGSWPAGGRGLRGPARTVVSAPGYGGSTPGTLEPRFSTASGTPSSSPRAGQRMSLPLGRGQRDPSRTPLAPPAQTPPVLITRCAAASSTDSIGSELLLVRARQVRPPGSPRGPLWQDSSEHLAATAPNPAAVAAAISHTQSSQRRASGRGACPTLSPPGGRVRVGSCLDSPQRRVRPLVPAQDPASPRGAGSHAARSVLSHGSPGGSTPRSAPPPGGPGEVVRTAVI